MEPAVSPPRLDEVLSPDQRFLAGMGLLVGHFVVGGIGQLGFLPEWLDPAIGPAFLLGALLAMAKGLGASIRPSYALYAPPVSQLGWCVVAGLALVAPMSILGALNSVLVEPAPWFLEAMEELEPEGIRGWVTLLLLTAVLVPLAEELLFRGLIQPAASAALGPTRAMLVVGLIFALVHFQPWNLLPLAVIGIVLGLVRLTTASVIGCAVVHGAYNCGAMVIGRLVRGADDEVSALAAGMLMIVAFAGAYVCWFALGRLRPVSGPPA